MNPNLVISARVVDVFHILNLFALYPRREENAQVFVLAIKGVDLLGFGPSECSRRLSWE